jgi:general secretion pathway protein K
MQGLVDTRAKQALTSIDDLWQLPSLSGLDEKQRGVLAPLLAVDSQAFMALITATDNATVGQTRQRFATVLISKTAANDSQATNENGDNNSDVNSEKPKEVKVVTQRLWAFRPSF